MVVRGGLPAPVAKAIKPKEKKKEEVPDLEEEALPVSTPIPPAITGGSPQPNAQDLLRKVDELQSQVTQAKSYPSQQPRSDLTPTGNWRNTVIVNPNGTVDYSLGGRTFNLNREEYEAMKGVRDGKLPSNVDEIRALENELRKKSVEFKEGKITPSDQEIGNVSQSIDEQLQALAAAEQAPKQGVFEKLPKDALPNVIMAKLGAETPSEVPGVVIKQVAEIYDFVYSLTQGGKDISQKEAENTMADLKTSINFEFDQVSKGLKSSDSLIQDIYLAEQTNNRLESSAKGLNKLNLRYYLLDGGKDIQTNAIINKAIIQDWKRMAAQAIAQGEAVRASQRLIR